MNLNRSISIRPLAATLLTAGIVFGGMVRGIARAAERDPG